MVNGSFVYRYSPRSNTLYLNITNRCSNKCSFCVRNYTKGLSGYTLWLPREPSIDELWNGRAAIQIKESMKQCNRACGIMECHINANLMSQ